MSEPLLSVRDLHLHYSVRSGSWRKSNRVLRAVSGVSFDLERGGCLGLVGESGSGKSSVARAVIGLSTPHAGSVRLDGVELTSLKGRARKPYLRRMGLVFQDPFASLDPRQSAESILTEPLRIHGLLKPAERRLRALALLDAVGLSPKHLYRYPHEFSGGQRQRIGIARALAPEPELLVLDEPVSALDVSVQAQVLVLLAELREQFGLSYLFIAHDLAVVRHICDSIAVMYLGQVVEFAQREELFEQPSHPYTRALLSAVPHLEIGRPRPQPLAGEIPSPLDPPPGCTFHPRCPERERVADDRCSTESPRPISRGRRGTCHLLDS